MKNLMVFFCLALHSCSIESTEENLRLTETLEVENLNDQEALGETFIATIKLPTDISMDTILFDIDLPDLDVIEQDGSVVFKSLVDKVGVVKIQGKIIGATE